MARQPALKLTPVQLEIMNLFWDQGELGVAQVWKILARRRPVARNTVQTMLARLADRGWLLARAEANAFHYRAAHPRKYVLTRMMGNMLDTAFAGSPSGLVMALLENRRITPEDARRIRELIDRAEKEKP